jgi:hypothetical protein
MKVNCRAIYKLSRLSYIMPFGFLNLQLWWKYLADVQKVLLRYFMIGLVVTMSNVVLCWLLGVMALTEEEQLYIRLCRLGKYFSTGEEICTYYWSDLNRSLELPKCIPFRACCISSYASMRFIVHSCNRCTGGSDTPQVREIDSRGGSRGAEGAWGPSRRRSSRRRST